MMEVTQWVDVGPIKGTAKRILPADSLLRRVLSSEPDKMSPSDYVAKLGTWLAIMREEFK